MPSFLKKTALYELLRLFGRVGMSLRYFLPPFVFSFVSAFFEACFMALLVPTISLFINLKETIPDKIYLLSWLPVSVPESLKNTPMIFLGCLVLSIFLSSFLKALSEFGSSFLVALRVNEFASNLRIQIFEKYLAAGKSFHDKNSSGQMMGVILSFVSEISRMLIQIRGVMSHGFHACVYLAILFYTSWKLAILSLVLFPVVYLCSQVLNKRIFRFSQDRKIALDQYSQTVHDALYSLPLIKAYAMEGQECQSFTDQSRQIQKVETKIGSKIALLGFLQDMTTLSTLVFLLFMTGLLISKKILPAQGIQYVFFFFVLRRLASAVNIVMMGFASINSISGYLKSVWEVFEMPSRYFVPSGSKKIETLKSGIECRNLNFGYTRIAVLKDISLNFKANSMTALVGPSGAGKTTLLAVLQRLYDCAAGSVFFDGVDIRELDSQSLQKMIAVVSQESLIRNGTLRQNLCFGLSPEPSESQLWAMLEEVQLKELFKNLPNQLDTPLGERGLRLSGGEKQRVSIARALLKNTPILLLDEATSHLDSETESLIQKSIEKLIWGKTVIVVAHRLSTIRNAQTVVVLSQGKVQEVGSFDELMKKRQAFYHLYHSQQSLPLAA